MSAPATSLLRIDAEELAGDLPLVCARTGRHDALATPVWFARSPSWAWLPLALLLLAAMATTAIRLAYSHSRICKKAAARVSVVEAGKGEEACTWDPWLALAPRQSRPSRHVFVHPLV